MTMISYLRMSPFSPCTPGVGQSWGKNTPTLRMRADTPNGLSSRRPAYAPSSRPLDHLVDCSPGERLPFSGNTRHIILMVCMSNLDTAASVEPARNGPLGGEATKLTALAATNGLLDPSFHSFISLIHTSRSVESGLGIKPIPREVGTKPGGQALFHIWSSNPNPMLLARLCPCDLEACTLPTGFEI